MPRYPSSPFLDQRIGIGQQFDQAICVGAAQEVDSGQRGVVVHPCFETHRDTFFLRDPGNTFRHIEIAPAFACGKLA